jgi:CheY-like chemotaxis protein
MFTDHLVNRNIFPEKWILIVEDNIEMQAMLLSLARKRYGSEGNMLATAVSSARHAWALLEDIVLLKRLHCILADHDTQWGSGSELLRYISHQNITVPVCGISGIPANNTNMKTEGAVAATNKLDFVGIWNFLDNVDKGAYKKSPD